MEERWWIEGREACESFEAVIFTTTAAFESSSRSLVEKRRENWQSGLIAQPHDAMVESNTPLFWKFFPGCRDKRLLQNGDCDALYVG
jgi:hypothetical protein